MRISAILNTDGGTLKTADIDALTGHLEEAFGESGHAIHIEAIHGDALPDALLRAGNSDCDVILAGGGDGTISATAETAWRTGKALGVLPAGTMNFYAQTLGVPLDLHAAVDALAKGRLIAGDIATANGRPFIHQFSVGLQASMVAGREQMTYRSRLGKIVANIRAGIATLLDPPVFRATVDHSNERFDGKVSLIAVSNNPHGPGHLPYADHPDAGVLGLYRSAQGLAPAAAAKLAADMLTGAWQDNPDLVVQEADHVLLRFPGLKRKAKASIDGELIPLEAEVNIRMHPGELRLLVPAGRQFGQ